jgi:POT family proton-dependent oligopeptide transporter
VELGPIQPVDGRPTPEELETLPRVCDKIPYAIFFIVVAEVAERFTYRSLTGPMRKSGLCLPYSYCHGDANLWSENYIQNPLHDSDHPGALGKVCTTDFRVLIFRTHRPSSYGHGKSLS